MYCCLPIAVFLFAVPFSASYFWLVSAGYRCVAGGTDTSRPIPELSLKTAMAISALTATISLSICTACLVVESQLAYTTSTHGEVSVVAGLIIGSCVWVKLTRDRLPTSYGHALTISFITWTSAAALWYVIDRWLLSVLDSLAG